MSLQSDILDVIVEPRYDTQTILAAGSLLLTFFQVPIGQGATNYGAATVSKSVADTNMDLAGQLPAGYNFVILGFRVQPSFKITQADIGNWCQGATFIFSIGSKDFLRVPVETVPQGNGPMAFYTQAAAANAAVGSHGYPMLSNSFSIARKPLELAQTQNFRAAITWPTLQPVTTTITGQAAAGLPVRVYIDGFLKRYTQ